MHTSACGGGFGMVLGGRPGGGALAGGLSSGGGALRFFIIAASSSGELGYALAVGPVQLGGALIGNSFGGARLIWGVGCT